MSSWAVAEWAAADGVVAVAAVLAAAGVVEAVVVAVGECALAAGEAEERAAAALDHQWAAHPRCRDRPDR